MRWVAILFAIVVVLGGGTLWLHHRQVRPSVRQYPVMGVRLDQSDGYQDFVKLHKSGVDFAYLKVSEGASYTDDDFAANFQHSSGSGVAIGVYHDFSFDSTPAAQFKQFSETAGANIGTLPVGIHLRYYGQYEAKHPAAAKMRQTLTTLIALLQARYHCAVVLIGTPGILKQVAQVSPTSGRWVISRTKPTMAHTSYWQYATTPLPHGGDASYRSVVFAGTRQEFARQAKKNP